MNRKLITLACLLSASLFAETPDSYKPLLKMFPGMNPPAVPKTMYPVPEKRSMDERAIREAEPYLKLTPEKYLSLVPKESPAPVLTESDGFDSSYNSAFCPFCGERGTWFRYDLVNDPDHVYCAQTGKDIMSFAKDGKDFFTDYSGKKYTRAFYLTPHIKKLRKSPPPVKAYPENYVAARRIVALCGTYKGGALPALAKAYYATGDEKYAVRAIAILEGFAKMFPACPWTSHSRMKGLPREELLAKAKVHESGYHGWLGPARLAASESNFRTPTEALYFSNFAEAYQMLEPSKSWNGRKEFIRKNLLEEGAIQFYAYGAKQCMGNGIGMYLPVLQSLGVALQDQYLYSGFVRILEEFLYNENYYDGLSTEGSVAYSGMVGGMWSLAQQACGANPDFAGKNPFLHVAGKTRTHLSVSRGGESNHGDNHPGQYNITRPQSEKIVPGGEFGGFGISAVRAGDADHRMELFLSHDRIMGHSHDDMLGIQIFYRGIPLLEHFGDTRNTADLTSKVAHYTEYAKLKYPAPFVTNDPRPRGFALQDVNTPLTKNRVIVDEYREANSWLTAYRGGGFPRAAWGNPVIRTAAVPETLMQFVEMDGEDVNSNNYQSMAAFRRGLITVVRPDGRPYVADFFRVEGGHRHIDLFHSRGKEVASTLGKGKDYAHLEEIPDNDMAQRFQFSASCILAPGKVLNNVNAGATVRGIWKHTWLFDYAGWAPKTIPLDESLRVQPHYLTIYGFFSGAGTALRADGHYPVTIHEYLNGKDRSQRFQFENAVHYAGIVKQQRDGLRDTYIHVFDFYSDGEKPLFTSVEKMENDAKSANSFAMDCNFPDGTRDIVIHQDSSKLSSWDGELFSTDARAALIRINAKGKVQHAEMAGGTILTWRGRTILSAPKATFVGKITAVEGDLSGDRTKSAFVIESKDPWLKGTELQGQYVIAGFNQGKRRETYKVDSVEDLGNGKYRINLADHPFFIDTFGVVQKPVSGHGYQFLGSGTNKGTSTDYLTGSKVVFPEAGMEFTLGRISGDVYKANYTMQEKINLQEAGLKEGMRFCIHPDWKNALLELTVKATK